MKIGKVVKYIFFIIICMLLFGVFSRYIGYFYTAKAKECLYKQNYTCAINFSKTALKWYDEEHNPYYILGKSYNELGEPDLAISYLQKGLRIDPKDLLILGELAIAYEMIGQPEYALVTWQQAGITADVAELMANTFINHARYKEALVWFYRAGMHLNSEELSPDRIFKLAIAALISNDPQSAYYIEQAMHSNTALKFHPLVSDLEIQGKDLLWLSNTSSNYDLYGHSLTDFQPQNPNGIMWWNGQAITLLDVQQAGTYLVTARLKHSTPAPIEMAFDVNGSRIVNLSLDKNDNSWEDINFEINFNSGVYVLGVWFLNNDTVNNIDRNAEIGWVRVEKIR